MLGATEQQWALIHKRLAMVEQALEERDAVERVRKHLQQVKATSAYLKTTPRDYYSWKLNQRGEFLQCQIPHLCKSIIVENVACTNEGIEDPLNSRYYCVIVQYNSKLNTEQLMRFVRAQIPETKRPARKHFNFQHAPAEVSQSLTGFLHNGVSPYGMSHAVPVIVSQAIAELVPKFIWMGGGAENVKLRINVEQLVASLAAKVADVTVPRDDWDDL